MRPLTPFTATVLTIIVIVSIGFLPAAIGTLQDQFIGREAAYAEINAVELQMDNSSIWERLMLLGVDSEFYEISPEQANIAETELYNIVLDGLQPYADCGLLRFLPDLSTDVKSVSSYLLYDPINAASGSIFWSVVFHTDTHDSSIELILDDRTGKILTLNHYSSNYFDGTALTPDELLNFYLSTYLDEIGIETIETQITLSNTTTTLSHVAVLAKLPDSSSNATLSFIVSHNGLSMHISTDENTKTHRSYGK